MTRGSPSSTAAASRRTSSFSGCPLSRASSNANAPCRSKRDKAGYYEGVKGSVRAHFSHMVLGAFSVADATLDRFYGLHYLLVVRARTGPKFERIQKKRTRIFDKVQQAMGTVVCLLLGRQ